MFKNRKAQQLVEFLLVAPFIVIFLGVLTEYAYALNCNLTLSQGLKQVTSTIYREIVPNISESTIKDYVKSELTNYLQTNNVPVGGSYTLDIGYNLDSSKTNAVFVASYNYTPAFTLPNVFFHILPEKFTFMATSSVPTAFLSSNAYDSSINSTQLDKIWNISADFPSADSFKESKRGIMKKKPSDSVNMLFFVPITVLTPAGKFYAVIDWAGIQVATLNLTDGNLYNCDALKNCTSRGINLLSAYSGIYNFVFVHDLDADTRFDQLYARWIYTQGWATRSEQPISDDNMDGILKRTLAISWYQLSGGNYDNLNVPSYNASVADPNIVYTVDTFGSAVFVHNSVMDNISSLITGSPPSNSFTGSSEF